MSHTPKPRFSTVSQAKRVTSRASKSSNKDVPASKSSNEDVPASKSSNKDVPSTEDESRARDQALLATDDNEESTEEAMSFSQEELQILDDLHALESVLADMINRRAHGSDASQTVNVSPSSRSSSASGANGPTKGDEEQLIDLEDQRTQEDVRKLDRFLDEILDRRAHGRQTPPLDAMATTAEAGKAMADVSGPAQLKDSHLSQIVAINDDITKEIEKIDAELRKTRTRGILKTGTGQPRRSEPSSSPMVATRSTLQTPEVTDDGQYGERLETNGEEGTRSNSEGSIVPSESSSVQTLPPPYIEPIVQYNSDFSLASPADPLIQQAIRRILALKTTFPDQNLYLISASSFPLPGTPQLISSIFEIPSSAQGNMQVTGAPTLSSSFPGRLPYVPAPFPDANTTASVEMEAPSEKVIPKKMENLIGQTFLDHFIRPKASPTAGAPNSLPQGPIIVEISDNKSTVIDHHFVVPDGRESVGDLEQRARTVSLPAEFNGTPLQNFRQTRETSPAILMSAVFPAQPEPTKYVEVMLDHQQSGVKTAATSAISEVSGAVLKPSLRSATATQSSVRQIPTYTISSSDTVAPVPLATDPSISVKKKVSFADMPSTMYIIVNPTPEDLEASMQPSTEVVGFQPGWETEMGVASETVCCENDMEAMPQNSPSSPFYNCAPHARLTVSTPSSHMRPDPFDSCSNEANRNSTETVRALIPSSHAVTGSITHVMSRARSSAEHGRPIFGSMDRWVTQVNSRNLSCSSDDLICPCRGCGSCHSNACDCPSIQGVSPTTSDVAAAIRQHASCSNWKMNTNCSCSRTRSGGESDSQPPAKEGSIANSFPEDTHKAGSFASPDDCKLRASDSENSGVCSATSILFSKRDRKRTMNSLQLKKDS